MSGEVQQSGASPRICFLLDNMAVGGVQALVITLCRRLLAEGCKVDLVIRLPGSSLMSQRVPDGVRMMLLREASTHSRTAVFPETVQSFVIACFRPVCRLFRLFRQAKNAEHDANDGPLRRWGTRMEQALHHIGPLLTGTGLQALWSLQTANRRTNHPLSFLQTAYFAACSRHVARYIETEKPDVMYTAWDTADITALLGRRAARRKLRLIISLHSSLRSLGQESKLELMSHFIAEADAVHAVSRGMADEAVEDYGISREKIMAVYNPAFHNEILNLKQQKCDHPWITEKGEEKILLWAGRLHGCKDSRTMLRAFRLLCQRRDARLIMLGLSKTDVSLMSSEMREFCNRFEDRVLTPGHVANPYPWMAAADVFVLSSKSEGLPSVLIEAMACGCPVVSTDCKHGPREILEDGRWGRLTPVGDSEALADAIDATLDNPPPAEELLARARDFSEERAMPQFLEMLGLPGNTRAD